ncbi:NAD-dependent epimerase/dehydratase family protein [Herbiconiux sp. YIM B11900]|uniref:NAD-dependent epimerase/dehydratase family protein n=1 Tax=Herbiconiux sp. YIM B11900 TaxID=3404131 RepID=UPI003F87825C
MAVLVTGASGFVGGALLRRLTGDSAFAPLGIGRRAIDDPCYRAVDLAAPDAARALGAAWAGAHPGASGGPAVIVHAAAHSSPWGSRAEFERANVDTTRAVLDYARSLPRPPRLVFISTASVLYRARDQAMVPDDAPADGPFVNAYAASKRAAERLVEQYPGEWVVLRPRAVFGPGDTTLLPRFVTAARAGRLPRIRPPRSGAVLSDLVVIDTLVEHLVTALTSPALNRRTLTVTNGEPVALQPTVFGLLERIGVALPRRTVSRRGALWAATVVEAAWRMLRPGSEPPITRYSVIVYAFTKTFDARLCRELLGAPAVTVAEGLERVVAENLERVVAEARAEGLG